MAKYSLQTDEKETTQSLYDRVETKSDLLLKINQKPLLALSLKIAYRQFNI